MKVHKPVRGARSTAALYGTLSSVLVVAALVMALIVRPPPPPSIAALGPSPQEQIEEARKDQAAGADAVPLATSEKPNEQAPGSTRSGDASATPTTPPAGSSDPAEVPATRRCFGDPPRQTEDPHSPPCVFELFQGDNGGTTAFGVTATEIHVVWNFGAGCYAEDTKEVVNALLNHFNRRYELYGRRIVLDTIDPGSDNRCAHGHSDPSATNALADEVISRRPFASIIDAPRSFQAPFHRRLAEAGIHSIQGMSPTFPSNELMNGWTWLLRTPQDVNQRLGGELVCRSFNGRSASHAGAGVRAQSRKFAVIAVTVGNSIFPDTRPLMARLDSCGANAEDFPVDVGETSDLMSLMRQLQAENYTTIIAVPEYGAINENLRWAANNSGYFPEWFSIDIILEELEFAWSTPNSQRQAPYAFGFTGEVRVRPENRTPAFWALEEGGGPSAPVQAHNVERLYKQILLLASGIQGAGPNLTPSSFRQALWTMSWPNPNPGGPPYWQQRVSLGPGDPVFYDDYAIWKWDENAPSQTRGFPTDNDGRGSFCYLGRGVRFMPGSFPGNVDTRLGQDPCR